MKVSMTSVKVMLAATMMLSSSATMAMIDHHAVPDHIKAAVASPDRTDKDRKNDAWRKPAEMLTFAGIQPGMTVLDINSGGGYYTEMVSSAVGAEGSVIAHNGGIYWDFFKDNAAERFTGRLANVSQVHNGHEEIDLEAGSVDVAMMMMAYHDYYHEGKARTKDEDIPAILATIKAALKEGGSFIVTDHVALAGSGREVGETLHRIDPGFVKAQVLAAGFKLAATSDILANSADDHTIMVFDKAIRFKTDRFVFKFVK